MVRRVLIFEDEQYAADQITDLLNVYDSEFEIVGIIDTVKEGIDWFMENEPPDLILMDIQLSDGSIFEIFEYIQIESPIIFTTAYDEYAIKAFRVNSIDYLLKPINQTDLYRAIDKYKNTELKNDFSAIKELNDQIEELMRSAPRSFKQRFLISIAGKYNIINISEIMYFKIIENAVFLTNTEGRSYPVNYTLDHVLRVLDPECFYRVNRKYIVNLEAIESMVSYSQNRLKIKIAQCQEDIIVSRERVKGFKLWIEE